MARNPVSVFKRPMTKKGQYRYYIQFWDSESDKYSVAKSATMIARELGLNPQAYPPTSHTGALLIGQEYLHRGGSLHRTHDPLFADYCAEIWDWERSPYIKGKLVRGQRIGREYVSHNAAYVENYIRPAFPKLLLSNVKPYMIEELSMTLKEEGKLSNRSINAILAAMTVPLNEAARLGHITNNLSKSIRKLGNDSVEKGIPSIEEVKKLLALTNIDLRIKASIMLGATCAMRLGEIQALKMEDIDQERITIVHSWSKVDGLKTTKTDTKRIVPLPHQVSSLILELIATNPHGPTGFLIYGTQSDKPLDTRALERGFYKALEAIGITEQARIDRNLSFHSLRHWANSMLRGSISDTKLRLLTGHSTEAMTNRYDHATESDLSELAIAQEVKILALIG